MDTAQETKQTDSHMGKVHVRKAQTNTVTRFFGEVDRPFLLLVVLLVCLGIVTVFSSSYSFAETKYGDSYYLAKSQLMYALVGLFIMAFIAFFARTVLHFLSSWQLALVVYAVVVLLNLAVPFVGVNLNGATRWIKIGPIQFQPSELLKFSLVWLLSVYANRFHDRMHKFGYGFAAVVGFALPALFSTILQRHLSATLIILSITIFMMVYCGTAVRLIATTITAVLALAGVALSSFGRSILGKILPHVLTRLEIWQNPFAYMTADTGGKGWQPVQSLYAISSGGLWGVGLGQSNQKHGYLPEPFNDYIFAILCEETGFLGAVATILLFAVFAWRGFYVASKSKDLFSAFLVRGIITHVIIQVVLNLAVVTNSIPSTGIGLPFFSYGGTSLIILLAEMGIILAVSRFSYEENTKEMVAVKAK